MNPLRMSQSTTNHLNPLLSVEDLKPAQMRIHGWVNTLAVSVFTTFLVVKSFLLPTRMTQGFEDSVVLEGYA